MKRLLPHFAFWLLYLAFLTGIEIIWLKQVLPPLNTNSHYAALKACLVSLPPQMLFAYYLSYCGLINIVQKKRLLWLNLLQIVTVLLLCILLYRTIMQYITAACIYHIENPVPFFNLDKLMNILLYISFATGLMVAIKSVRSLLLSKERENMLVKEKLSNELKMLRSQLNPHFLFNTLNNIYALTRKKSDLAPEAVMKLSELLNFMLYESGRESIPLSGEIRFLEDYIALERIRYDDRLTVTFQKETDNPTQLIAPLLLLPFLENAFKHGAGETRFASFIHLRLQLQQQQLSFAIENSFEDPGTSSTGHNIGLKSTRRRLELLYPNHSLTINRYNNIFSVNMQINLANNGEI